MKHKHVLKCLMAAAFCFVTTMAYAQQGFEFDDVPSTEQSATSNATLSSVDTAQFTVNFNQKVISGEWIWVDESGENFDQAVSACVDGKNVKTIYVGGNNGLYVSQDAGESWSEVLHLSSYEAPSRQMEDITANLADEQIIRFKRDFIYNEVSSTYDTSFADAIDDEITDDELLIAETTDDIDIFSEYDLDIEKDLSHAFDSVSSDDLEDTSTPSSHLRFVDRYAAQIAMGADPDEALEALSGANAVWDIYSNLQATWALTSENLHVSHNSGKTWVSLLPAVDQPLVSFAISESGQDIAVGTTNGIQLSRDGGKTWTAIQTGNIILKLAWTRDGRLLVASSAGAGYLPRDGKAIVPLAIDLRNDEVILDIAVSERSEAIFLTENTLFYVIPDGRVSMIPNLPFDTEYMRQIVIDKTMDHVVLRTDVSVYELRDGLWRRQTEGLFGDITRSIALIPNNVKSPALLVTDSGVMSAMTSVKYLNDSEKYELLKRQWAQEPTDAEIIHAALIAHGLDDDAVDQWKTRIWTSMLLPRVNFSYYQKNTMIRRPTVTDTYTDGQGTTRTFAWDQQKSKVHYWEVMAHWDFALDVHQKDEINVQRLSYRQAADRQRLITTVAKVIRDRHKQQMNGLKATTSKSGLKKEIKRLLALAELEAQLYYLTGGYFRPKHD